MEAQKDTKLSIFNELIPTCDKVLDVCGTSFYHVLIEHFFKEKTNPESKIFVIDCDNRFDPYIIIKAFKYEREKRRDILNNLMISRVFTIHQLFSKIRDLKIDPKVPLIVSGMDILVRDADVPKIEMKNVVKAIFEKLENIKNVKYITTKNKVYLKY